MLYQRSLDFERRLQTVLKLIESGRFSTPDLADEVGVSIPTISRDVTALRQRGHRIIAEREDGTSHYVLAAPEQDNNKPDLTDKLRKTPR